MRLTRLTVRGALATEPSLVADGLEFVFRKTTTARAAGYDDAFYAGLAQQLSRAAGAGERSTAGAESQGVSDRVAWLGSGVL